MFDNTRPVTHRLVRYSTDAELQTETLRLFEELRQTQKRLTRCMQIRCTSLSRKLADDMAILSGQLGLFLQEMERRQNQQVPEPLSEAEKALLPLL